MPYNWGRYCSGLGVLLLYSSTVMGQGVYRPVESGRLAERLQGVSGPQLPLEALVESQAPAAIEADLDQPVQWDVDIQAPAAIRRLLLKYLDVVRYRELYAGQPDEPPIKKPQPTPQAQADKEEQDQTASKDKDSLAAFPAYVTLNQLRRLVAATPDQIRSLLETEGYFSPEVHVDFQQPLLPIWRLSVQIRVEPGQLTKVASVVLKYAGELDQLSQAGDLPALDLQRLVQEKWRLSAGHIFTQTDWAAAKREALALLHAQGYLASIWEGSSARIDPAEQAAQLFLIADSGPLFHFGPLEIKGLERVPAEVIVNLRTFHEGSVYNEKRFFDFQEQLRKVGLFDNVSVSIDQNPVHAQAAPIQIVLKEKKLQQTTIGLGYSANTGERVSLEQISRRVFGYNWQAKTVVELGTMQRIFRTDFTSYPLPGKRYNLFSAAIEQLKAAGVTMHSQRVRIGRSRDQEHITRMLYLEWERDKVAGDDGPASAASALTANWEWIWRHVDNMRLPTRGFLTSVNLSAGRSYATTQSEGGFGRLLWRNLFYYPFPHAWFGSARLDFGRVFASAGIGVPDAILFRAGGDGSIRGYSYRSIGPVRNNIAVGARSLVTGSVEMAHPLSADKPDWLWAVFVDSGDAGKYLSNLHFKTGYGVGLRWRSPVGALRFDVAYGRRVHLHLSLGIVF